MADPREDLELLLVEHNVGDAAAAAIGHLERAMGGLQVLSVEQVALFVGSLRALDRLYRSVNREKQPQ